MTLMPQTNKALPGQWVGRLLSQLQFAISAKRRLHGLPVGIFTPSDSEAQRRIFATIESAMKLIADISPICYARIRRDFRGILVCGVEGVRAHNARWNRAVGMCELDTDYMCSADATPADVAATIIHEATHARLLRAGIDFEEERRARVERACFRAEIRFAKRLPDGQPIIDAVKRNMQREQSFWTDDAFLQRDAGTLIKLGCPRWVVQLLKKIRERRAARRHGAKTGTS